MARITVRHETTRDGWEHPKDGSGTWINYWRRHSLVPCYVCSDCGEFPFGDNPMVGAHVKKVDGDDGRIYIVPTCRACNSRGAKDHHEFVCDRQLLVPANVNNL